MSDPRINTKENNVTDLRTAVQDARKRLEAKAIAATTNDADGAYMDAVKCLDQILAEHSSAPQPVVDREAVRAAVEEVAVATGLAKYFKAGGAEDPSDVEEFVAAVMELARPMPTREQIAEALLKVRTSDGGFAVGGKSVFSGVHRDLADAVLALLNGEAK